MAKPSSDSVIRTLIDARPKGQVSWRDICDAIEAACLTIKKWLTVRNTIQGYINAGFLCRTDDIRVENYTILPRAA